MAVLMTVSLWCCWCCCSGISGDVDDGLAAVLMTMVLMVVLPWC